MRLDEKVAIEAGQQLLRYRLIEKIGESPSLRPGFDVPPGGQCVVVR